jgi:hypothetical protein
MVDEAEYVSHVAEFQLIVERLLALRMVVGFGLAPRQCLCVLIVLQMGQLALFGV